MATDTTKLAVDFGKGAGTIRALNGINKGPLDCGGLIDVSAQMKAIAPPYSRLHDCHWPVPDVVDIHAVFPHPDADPEKPESYDFLLTDEYIAATLATGAKIVYRLGESIEHTTTKRFVHPPQDPAKWAAICIGIIRHYNEGWANGFHHGIEHWEIWNEPEVRPQMWSGTDEDYLNLYRAAATAIKKRFPAIKVGGPGSCSVGGLADGQLTPSPFLLKLLEMCKRDSVPLDFLSWHCYTNDYRELALRCKGARKLLDDHGFAKAESHLNEWNYLPDNDWGAMSKAGTPDAKERMYLRMGGLEGAAFVASGLMDMQDAPLDVCNFYHGCIGEFGLMNPFGRPVKSYYALLAFHDLLRTPKRVAVAGAEPGKVAACAGVAPDGKSAGVLVSCVAAGGGKCELTASGLPWSGATEVEVRAVDALHDLTPLAPSATLGADGRVVIDLQAPCVALVTLRAK